MGCRKNQFVAQQIQKVISKVRKEIRELSCTCMFSLYYYLQEDAFGIGSNLERLGWGSSSSSYLYLYIHYYNYINKRSLFLLLPNEISLLSLIPSCFFLNVRTDFLTIRKYRKKDINNILLTIMITLWLSCIIFHLTIFWSLGSILRFKEIFLNLNNSNVVHRINSAGGTVRSNSHLLKQTSFE